MSFTSSILLPINLKVKPIEDTTPNKEAKPKYIFSLLAKVSYKLPAPRLMFWITISICVFNTGLSLIIISLSVNIV